MTRRIAFAIRLWVRAGLHFRLELKSHGVQKVVLSYGRIMSRRVSSVKPKPRRQYRRSRRACNRSATVTKECVKPDPAHLKLDEAQELGDLDGAHAEGALKQQQHRDGVEVEAAQRQLVQQDHAGRGDAVRRAREDLRQQSLRTVRVQGSGFRLRVTMLAEATQCAAPERICSA